MSLRAIVLAAGLVCACTSWQTPAPSRPSIAPAPPALPTAAQPAVEASAAPQAPLPQNATTEQETAMLLAPIDARAAKRKGFTATYRVQTHDGEQRIRYVYLAPDRARVDVLDGLKTLRICVIGESTAMQLDGDGPSKFAKFDWREAAAQWTECYEALDAAFQINSLVAGPNAELGAGLALKFELRADPKFPGHGEYSVGASWSKERSSFLSWLDPVAWNHARFVDAQVLEVSRDSTRATISVLSGMMLELTCGTRSIASLVELTDEVEESEFTLAATEGFDPDSSREYAAAVNADTCNQVREFVYRRILPAAHAANSDQGELRRRAEPVFVAMNRAITRVCYAGWMQQTVESIDQSFQKLKSTYAVTAGDPVQRQVLDRRIEDTRSSVTHNLESIRDGLLEDLTLLPIDCEDKESLTRLWNIDHDALFTAFQIEVMAPLLLRFDEDVKALRNTK